MAEANPAPLSEPSLAPVYAPAGTVSRTTANAGSTIYAIPNAHIDPVFIWSWREGMREVVATFRAAADRLEENPDLYFAASSAAYYAWVEQMDPDLFERIRVHVASGRWELVGGEWVEPDCNLPSGESIARQLLYSQRYFSQAFGKIATVGYNVDSFGHAGSLPQLLHNAGLDAYVMMRPQAPERALPASLFRWEGVDGTALTTYRLGTGYTTGFFPLDGTDPGSDEERELIAQRYATLVDSAATEQTPMMLFVGVGDHGGGPTRTAIRQIRSISEASGGSVRFASPGIYFAAISDLTGSDLLPTVRGDLHMHAVGCYSVVSWIKKENALCERSLVAAESLAGLCGSLTGYGLGTQTLLRSAWLRVLFNQFHDSLGGTCTEEAFDDIRQFYGYARTVADEVLTFATQQLAARIDTLVDDASGTDRYQSLSPYVGHYPVPVVAFNPLAWAVRVPLVLPHPAVAVTYHDGEPLEVQNVYSHEGTRYGAHATVVAELPALGWKLLWMLRPTSNLPDPVDARGERIENGILAVRADLDRQCFASIRSLATGREWMAPGGIRPVVLDDNSDTWSHGVSRYGGVENECVLEDARLLESGPVRSRLRLIYRWSSSAVQLEAVLYTGLGYVDLVVEANWCERHQVLKLLVPLAMASPRLTAGLPYGATERPTDGQEEVLHHWLRIDDATSGGGITLSGDGAYAYDASGGLLRLTVLRSPRYADHQEKWVRDDPVEHPVTDQGWHRVRYRLSAHEEPLPLGSGVRQAAEQGLEVPLVSETWHSGSLDASFSGILVEPIGVAATVFKRSEDGDGWVVRLVETNGRRGHARVVLRSLGREWEGSVRAHEVKTLFIPDPPGKAVSEIPLTELEDRGPQR